MGEVSYLPLIEKMRWSYSRIGTFRDCPYKFFMQYISEIKEEDKFYASYGSFIHKILEDYYNGDIKQEEMQFRFLSEFSTEVLGKRPKKEIVEKYIQKGSDYFKNFEPFPYEAVGIEEKMLFKIGDYDFIGYIDFLGKDDDGNFIIVDNKSRDLKPRSARKTPTVKDKELDSMLKQLYLYAAAVEQKYGKLPTKLCFNCFKAGVFIEEPFRQEAYDATIKWAIDSIEEIKREEDWLANPDYFGCAHICGVSGHCMYYDELMSEMKRKRRKK